MLGQNTVRTLVSTTAPRVDARLFSAASDTVQKQWAKSLQHCKEKPSIFKPGHTLDNGVAFFKKDALDDIFPTYTSAADEIKKLDFLDLTHGIHYEENEYTTPDRAGRTDIGRIGLSIRVDKDEQDAAYVEFKRDFPETAQLILDAGARLAVHTKEYPEETNHVICRLLLFRPSWEIYTLTMHTDNSPAIHLPFPIKNCWGQTTFQDKFENPNFKVVSNDDAIITTDMPHESVTRREANKEGLRIVVNIIVL